MLLEVHHRYPLTVFGNQMRPCCEIAAFRVVGKPSRDGC